MPHVLLVDDDVGTLALLQAILAPDGYEGALAQDGASALRAVAARPPDLVLLDIALPGVDGLSVFGTD